MNSTNIPLVWPSFRKERKKLACYALNKFAKSIPEVHKRLVKLNEKDGFIMFKDKLTLKKKIFAEDEQLAEAEKREIFDIATRKPLYLSSDETS